jgi:hypothetical protein
LTREREPCGRGGGGGECASRRRVGMQKKKKKKKDKETARQDCRPNSQACGGEIFFSQGEKRHKEKKRKEKKRKRGGTILIC